MSSAAIKVATMDKRYSFQQNNTNLIVSNIFAILMVSFLEVVEQSEIINYAYRHFANKWFHIASAHFNKI